MPAATLCTEFWRSKAAFDASRDRGRSSEEKSIFLRGRSYLGSLGDQLEAAYTQFSQAHFTRPISRKRAKCLGD